MNDLQRATDELVEVCWDIAGTDPWVAYLADLEGQLKLINDEHRFVKQLCLGAFRIVSPTSFRCIYEHNRDRTVSIDDFPEFVLRELLRDDRNKQFAHYFDDCEVAAFEKLAVLAKLYQRARYARKNGEDLLHFKLRYNGEADD